MEADDARKVIKKISSWLSRFFTNTYVDNPVFPMRTRDICLVRRSVDCCGYTYDEIYLVWANTMSDRYGDFSKIKLRSGQDTRSRISIDSISLDYLNDYGPSRFSIELSGKYTNMDFYWRFNIAETSWKEATTISVRIS